MKKLNKQCIIAGVIIMTLLLVGLFSLLLFTPRHEQNLTPITDNGYHLAISNNLFATKMVLFEDGKTLIDGVYCDGHRLYTTITLSEEFPNLDCFRVITNDQNEMQNHKISLGNNRWVYIWDSCICSDKAIRFTYSASENQFVYSPEISINCDTVVEYEIKRFYEEIYLNSIHSAKTSTLFDINLYAHFGELSERSFQIQIGDSVTTCIRMKNEENHYTLLFPTIIDLENPFYMHITNSEGVLITIPVEVKYQ